MKTANQKKLDSLRIQASALRTTPRAFGETPKDRENAIIDIEAEIIALVRAMPAKEVR
jgi:hypothetical protein